jgi:hypothetical protein
MVEAALSLHEADGLHHCNEAMPESCIRNVVERAIALGRFHRIRLRVPFAHPEHKKTWIGSAPVSWVVYDPVRCVTPYEYVALRTTFPTLFASLGTMLQHYLPYSFTKFT